MKAYWVVSTIMLVLFGAAYVIIADTKDTKLIVGTIFMCTIIINGAIAKLYNTESEAI